MTAARDYERGLVQVGPHTYTFLQPNGSWGWSNSGLIVGEREAILVDTFFDLGTTRELLTAVRGATDRPISTLVNTHHNGDHAWGNQLVEGATIVGHRHCREQLLSGPPPEMFAGILQGEDDGGAISFLKRTMGGFDFTGITVTPPSVVFDDRLSLFLDGREIQLLHLGPAHTLGDIAVYVPEDKVLYTGDLLFLGSTPLLWEGSISNWIGAIDQLLALDVQTVVPGHGPVCGPDGFREMQDYLKLVLDQGRVLYEAGVPAVDAAYRIDLGPYAHWVDQERIVLNCMRLWIELDGLPPDTPADAFEIFTNMATYVQRHLEHPH